MVTVRRTHPWLENPRGLFARFSKQRPFRPPPALQARRVVVGRPLNLQHFPRLGHAGGGAAAFAGRDAGQGNQCTPAEGGAGGGAAVRERAVILLRPEGASLAHPAAPAASPQPPRRPPPLTKRNHECT